MDFEKIAWEKPSGHGPSVRHTIAEETDDVVTLFCGRTYSREDLEEIYADEASGDCGLCARGVRQRLLKDEGASLDFLVKHGAMTAKAAEILADEGMAEISHVEIKGSGKWGRILADDAREAVRTKEGA